MCVYFAYGSGLLTSDYAFGSPDVDTEAFHFAFIYYDVLQVL